MKIHAIRSARHPQLSTLLLAALLAAGFAGCGGASEDGLATAVPQTTDTESLRTTGPGTLVGGKTAAGAFAWRGVPFAAPPVGALRWRAPRPAEPWQGTREALAHPPACTQYQGFDPDNPPLVGQEDCLYLNIFSPAWAPGDVPTGDARVPVLVWIHGGGNSVGDAAPYDGSILARDYGVVVVAVQYRLGPLGWLHHPALSVGATPEDASGNYGTLDLIAALGWVQQNIAAFGGNPDNVTIFGESAGGRNVFSLMLSPLAKGLFHRGIAQSGSAGTTPTDEAGQARGRGGADNTGSRIVARLVPDVAVDTAPLPAVAEAMRQAPPEAVFEAVTGPRRMGMVPSPQIFADGVVLPRGTALEAFESGHYNRVPFITGTNRDETKLFQLGDDRLVRWWFGIPIGVRDAQVYDRDALYASQFWKLTAVDNPARRMRAAQGPSVYAYRFDWDEEPSLLWLDFQQLLGAAHALEIPFVFGSFDLGPLTPAVFDDDNAPGREELGRQMRSYWVEFARTGRPGQGIDGDLPTWEAWSNAGPDAPRLLMLDTPEGGGVRMSPRELTREGVLAAVAQDPRFADAAARCAFFDEARSDPPLDAAELRAGGCE